jgi:2-polyprenyl-3-methyl-5-hydroxy-6-metoxy-1,4-benzoquinol methylase
MARDKKAVDQSGESALERSMNKKFFNRSTYLRDDKVIRLTKAKIRASILQSYGSRTIRWYSRIRFHIINIDFLDTLEQHLSQDAKVLDIGCGFGLFSLYYAICARERTVIGFDLSQRRIAEAQAVAGKLNVTNARFFCQDAADFRFSEHYDAVVTLDLLHHVSPEVAETLINQAYAALTPRGVLLIKDVDTRPLHKLYFTYMLDKIMMPTAPVHYRSALAWKNVIRQAGFKQALSYPLNDYLPYPHVLIVARKD